MDTLGNNIETLLISKFTIAFIFTAEMFVYFTGLYFNFEKEKVIQKIIANNINVSEGKEKSKNRRNFAYSLTTGISLKVSDKANFEVTYSWQDFGKTKYKDKDITKNRYNGHSIMTGVRFDV